MSLGSIEHEMYRSRTVSLYRMTVLIVSEVHAKESYTEVKSSIKCSFSLPKPFVSGDGAQRVSSRNVKVLFRAALG